MTCINAQNMITSFIDNKLNIKEMEQFLDHIGSCASCREELEFYYALLTAMKQLDEDKNLSEDYRLELSSKLEAAQERIIHVKFTYYRKKALLILSMVLVAILISIGYAEKIQEKVNTVTVSNFKIRKPYRNERNTVLEEQLEYYFREHGMDQ